MRLTSQNHVTEPSAMFEWQELYSSHCSSAFYTRIIMGKSCCAVGCTNRYEKGNSLSFYRFPKDPSRRARWIAAVNRKNWTPSENTWICSAHFISGAKRDYPLFPDFVPTVFVHVESPVKRKATQDLARYERSTAAKKRKEERSFRQEAAMANEDKEDSTLTEDTGLAVQNSTLDSEDREQRSEGKEGTVDV